MQLVIQQSSLDQHISIYDTTEFEGEKGRFRVLQFANDAIQGAMDLNDPKRVVFEYPRALIHLMEYNLPSFEDAFIIGHGIGTIAGYFAKKNVKVAELDENIVSLSRTYFGYSGDNVRIGDGRQLLHQEKPASCDYILVDAFTEKGTPVHLVSRQFFDMAREKLYPCGYILLNLMGKGGQDRRISAIHTTLSEVFPYIKAFALPSEHAHDVQNRIMIAGNQPIGFQARQLAGFVEIEPEPGDVLWDD
ncbi:spermidine synthase [Paenibacillus rigui]|uniref:Spermidine synthase n=1 Tax=Paenibacillus rigui TaxID=554312 RepID=A0A229UW83_9BACL|nr:fused MFS/spermidine synthase [Paenibacillus rigui]OXM87573.1 spermidine synthase [Paenibacillus rigui]